MEFCDFLSDFFFKICKPVSKEKTYYLKKDRKTYYDNKTLDTPNVGDVKCSHNDRTSFSGSLL